MRPANGSRRLGATVIGDAADAAWPASATAAGAGAAWICFGGSAADFATGGTVPIGYKVYMWTDPTPNSPESGDECLGDGTTCGEAFPLITGGVCPGGNPNFCGITNTATIDAAWRSNIQPTQFAEVGINLSQVAGVAGRCYRTFMAEGRVMLQGDPADIRAHKAVVESYLGQGHV